LRIAGGPLHLPLLQAAMPTAPAQLAFLPPELWAEQLLAGCVDAVLVSVAGDAAGDPAVLWPPLQPPGVEAIGLGQRELVLLYHPAPLQRHSQLLQGQPQRGEPRGGRQRMGYLLPPPGAMPLLHRALEREDRLPLHSCGDLDHRSWLEQLRGELLLLPAHPAVLHLPGWCDAGLVLRQPLRPLIESLWLLLRRGEAERPGLAQLLQWWGGPQITRPQVEKRPRIRRWPGLGGLWRWRWGGGGGMGSGPGR